MVQTLSAQDGSQSLGDFARQERERKKNQAAAYEAAEASEIAGLKEASFKANILITDSQAATANSQKGEATKDSAAIATNP